MADIPNALDKGLAISGTVLSATAYIFYKLYQNRTETARKVKELSVWQADLELHDYLSMRENQSLDYAAIEGQVKEIGRTIRSYHTDTEGVHIERTLVEHKSRRDNGFWKEVKKELQAHSQSVPFSLVKPDGDPELKVEVTEIKSAKYLSDDLDVTFNQFEPHKTNLVQIGVELLFGEVTKGVEETEKMLITGTSLLGIGRITLEKGKARLGPPEETDQPYILTKMSLKELVRAFESQSYAFKVVSIVCGLLGGGMLVFIIFRHAKLWWDSRRQRREFEEIRRLTRIPRRPRVQDRGEMNQDPDADSCVVCLDNPRQVITLNCGHISMCADCAEALPLPKKCPVCRQEIDRFMPVFRP